MIRVLAWIHQKRATQKEIAMSRRKSEQSRVTVYRLTGLRDLRKAVRETYSDFRCCEVKVGGRGSLLFYGATRQKAVRWSGIVSGLSGTTVDLATSSPGAVLLIPEQGGGDISDASPKHEGREKKSTGPNEPDLTEKLRDVDMNAWAITFGVGFQMLDQRYVDIGFGKRVAIRCVDPSKMNSVTKVTLDDRSKTVRSSIPSGANLRGFDFEDVGELVTRLVAPGRIDGIGAHDRMITVRGADALSIPLANQPEKIVEDLDLIQRLLREKPMSDDLALLEKVTKIPSKKKEYIARLNEKLVDAIVNHEASRIALAWPHEAVDEIGEVQAFQLHGTQTRGHGAVEPKDGFPTLDDLLLPVRDAPEEGRLRRLESMSVTLLENADGDPRSRKIPAKNWLSFEVDLEGKKHFLHNGCWYVMEEDYPTLIRKRTEEIFQRESPIKVIPWTKEHADEKEYNVELAKAIGGVCLDRQLIAVGDGGGRIETCDVLLKDGVFVHVKRINASAPASHLLSQALVSADVLTYDEEVRNALRNQLRSVGEDPDSYECSPKKVVLVMVKDNEALTADSLFTFTQVNLSRQDKALANRGVDVYVVPICRTTV